MTESFPKNTEASITAIDAEFARDARDEFKKLVAIRPDEAPEYNERDFLEFLVDLVTETGGAAKESISRSTGFDTIFDEATQASAQTIETSA